MESETFVLRIPKEAVSRPSRAQLIEALDRATRPMDAREIEHALRGAGVSKSQSVKLGTALKNAGVVLLVINENERTQ